MDGTRPTRETFMTTLASLDAILIRSTYYADMSTAVLRALSMDTASPQPVSHTVASIVEQCSCPEGYVGLSCEVSEILPEIDYETQRQLISSTVIFLSVLFRFRPKLQCHRTHQKYYMTSDEDAVTLGEHGCILLGRLKQCSPDRSTHGLHSPAETGRTESALFPSQSQTTNV